VKLHFRTSGMHCRSCSTLVDMMVSDVDGVESVTSDHVTGDISVTVSEGAQADIEAILAAIRSAGYDAVQL